MPEEHETTGAPDTRSASGHSAAPDERTVIDAAADLLQTTVDWLRQEAEALVREKVALPLQKAGLASAAAWAAAAFLVLGLGFIAVGLLMLLAQWLTWPGALLAVGGVLVLGSVIFTIIKMRSMQR
ncbi:MAG: hypothetical protein RBS78_02880 [Coriobacteriia bacterium]|jgi:hypothetical protein|nr:hypothetical protein [Coriobacteriia bacterium]